MPMSFVRAFQMRFSVRTSSTSLITCKQLWHHLSMSSSNPRGKSWQKKQRFAINNGWYHFICENNTLYIVWNENHTQIHENIPQKNWSKLIGIKNKKHKVNVQENAGTGYCVLCCVCIILHIKTSKSTYLADSSRSYVSTVHASTRYSLRKFKQLQHTSTCATCKCTNNTIAVMFLKNSWYFDKNVPHTLFNICWCILIKKYDEDYYIVDVTVSY